MNDFGRPPLCHPSRRDLRISVVMPSCRRRLYSWSAVSIMSFALSEGPGHAGIPRRMLAGKAVQQGVVTGRAQEFRHQASQQRFGVRFGGGCAAAAGRRERQRYQPRNGRHVPQADTSAVSSRYNVTVPAGAKAGRRGPDHLAEPGLVVDRAAAGKASTSAQSPRPVVARLCP